MYLLYTQNAHIVLGYGVGLGYTVHISVLFTLFLVITYASNTFCFSAVCDFLPRDAMLARY